VISAVGQLLAAISTSRPPGESVPGRLCCKSRFAPVLKNSKGYGRGIRVKMRGASSRHVKLIGDFSSAIEVIRIGDFFPLRIFAKIRSPATFDFCNTIGPKRPRQLCAFVSGVGGLAAARLYDRRGRN